jgi:predicted DsbA family dithiol-disulfide isomerase
MARSIAVTFDYRCPFAYNGHSSVIAALREGADLDVRYVPFSLDQTHVAEDEPAMWERDPAEWGTGVLALLYGIAARDHFAEQFLDAHLELFAARHVHGGKLDDEDVLLEAIARAGLDSDAVAGVAHAPETLKTLAAEHTEMVDEYGVFGVPTFLEGDQAVFVRLMNRAHAADVQPMLDLLTWTSLNEFKRTKIPR